MSQENLNIVRAAIDARNRDIEEWLTFFHPAAQTSDRLTVAGMRTEAQDLDELRRDAEQWHEIFDDFHMEIVELVDLDEELILAEVRFHGRGGASGAEVEVPQVDLYRVCDGLITEQWAGYRSRQEALEALGPRRRRS
jgi:ketosteroid isomerase-like protein